MREVLSAYWMDMCGHICICTQVGQLLNQKLPAVLAGRPVKELKEPWPPAVWHAANWSRHSFMWGRTQLVVNDRETCKLQLLEAQAAFKTSQTCLFLNLIP